MAFSGWDLYGTTFAHAFAKRNLYVTALVHSSHDGKYRNLDHLDLNRDLPGG